jgi:ATP-binding cassette subfamily F protein uup
VKAAYLSQHLEELDPKWRVLEAVEKVANRVQLGNGKELSASQLCERLGFSKDAQWTPVGDLSGGERRRLQLTRLLMDSPNVLILDEPTNDFDVETLTALEDLLDSFGGTMLVISHDRYFLERVCDTFVGLLGNKTMRDLPGGVEQYLALRRAKSTPVAVVKNNSGVSNAALQRDLKKEITKLDRQIEKAAVERSELMAGQIEFAMDYEKLAQISAALNANTARQAELEEQWLTATTALEELG